MKLIKHSLLLLTLAFTTSFIITSCNDDDDKIENTNNLTLNKFKVIEKVNNISKKNTQINKEGIVIFETNKSIEFKIIDDNTFLYDIAKNGEFDLLVKKEDQLFYFYDNKSNEKIGTANLIVNNNIGTLYFNTVKNNNNLAAKGGNWRQCFESSLGSAEGIVGMAISTVGGPWSTAGFLSVVAVACAL